MIITKARFKETATSNIAIAVGTEEAGEVINISESDGVKYYTILFYIYGAEVNGQPESDLDVFEEEVPDAVVAPAEEVTE